MDKSIVEFVKGWMEADSMEGVNALEKLIWNIPKSEFNVPGSFLSQKTTRDMRLVRSFYIGQKEAFACSERRAE